MTFDDHDEFTLSNGRKLYANRGIIGVNPDGEVFEGYDGSLGDWGSFSAQERREIAGLAIELWKKWGGL